MLPDAQLAPELAALADEIAVTRDDEGVRAAWKDDVFTGTAREVAADLGTRLYKSAHTRMAADKELTPRTLRDPELDARFHKAVGDRTVRRDVEVVTEREDDVIVVLDKVRIAAPQSALERDGDRTYLHVDWARPAISPGFFFLTSVTTPMPRRPGALLRLYAHLSDPSVAPDLLAHVADHFESRRLPWQAKAASNQDMYPRSDALVVYLPRVSWGAIRPLADELTATGSLAEGTSAFTHRLSPSVGVAFEPADPRPGRDGLSFGQHRAQILAEALVSHAVREDEQTLAGRIVAAFNNASIDPLNPARNLSSPANPVIPAN